MKLSLHHCVKTGIPALVVLLIALPLAITFASPVAAVDTTAPQSTAQTTVVAEPALLTAQTGEDMAYNPLCGCESPFPRPPHDFTSPGGYYYHYTGTRCSPDDGYVVVHDYDVYRDDGIPFGQAKDITNEPCSG